MAYQRNGQPFDIDIEHIIDEIRYPVGWFYAPANRTAFGIADDGQSSLPPAPSLPETQNQRMRECDLLAKAKREAATADYAPAEMASWPIKLAEAQAYTADSAAATPRLTLEAAEREIPLADLVTKVLVKAEMLATLEAKIAGVNGRHNDAIKALDDVGAVLAYDISGGWPV